MAPIDPPRKRFRKLKWFFLLAVLTSLAAVGSLPWLASTAPGRALILSFANEALAPSRVEAASIRLSWLGSQEARGFVLRGKGGKAIVSARRAIVRRSLLGLAFERPIRANVTMDGGTIDLERRADGSVNLLEALATTSGEGSADSSEVAVDPAAPVRSATGPSLSLSVVNSSITIRSPELARPITARQFEMMVRTTPAPGPLTWQLSLAGPAEGGNGTLQLTGQLDQGGGNGLAAKLAARAWPVNLATGGLIASGRLDGDLDLTRNAAGWDFRGKGSVLGLDAAGTALAGDRLQLDRVDAIYALGASDEGWDLRRLHLTAPVGSIKAAPTAGGTKQASGMRVEGRLDLAALARMLPHLLRIREGLTLEKGFADVVAEFGESADRSGSTIVVDARVSDIQARDPKRTIAIRDPATLSARIARRANELQVERLAVKTAFLDASGTGDLAQGIKVNATLDLEGLESQRQQLVDFGGLQLAGRGRLAADYRRDADGRFVGRLSAEVQKLHVAGLVEQPISGNVVRLDAVAAGPIADAGLPQSWSQLRLAIKADDLNADTTLSTKSTDGSFEIEELRLAMNGPTAGGTPGGAPEPIRFASKGRFDANGGILELRPVPGAAKPEPVALSQEGVRITGLNQEGARKVTGTIAGDLARLDRALAWWWSSAPMDLAGAFSAKLGVDLKPDTGLTAAIALNSPDLSLPPSEGNARRVLGPAILAFQAQRPKSLDRIDLKNMGLAFRYGSVHVSGSVQEPGGKRLADLGGTITPNWTTIDPLVGQWVEPRARIRAVPRPFRVRGPLAGDGVVAILQGLEAELAVDRFEAVAFGARVAPTPIVIHWKGRQGAVEPIATTINNGPAKLLPDFVIDQGGTLSFRLAPGSSIHGAEINDEVSRTLLAYIAPMLHDATQVRGKVNVEVNRAEFPIMGDPARRSTLIGRVEFNDVVFSGGPLANELVALGGHQGGAVIKLDQPVELAIANGRVNQRGLSVPVGRDAKLELEGSVGFDKTIAMRARLPISRQMVGNREDVNQLVEGLRVGVPIGGTLSHPKIDRGALGAGVRDAGKTVLKRGAADLLKRLATPDGEGRPPVRRGR